MTPERIQCLGIRGHCVVDEEAAHDCLEPATLLRDGCVHAAPQVPLHFPELGTHAIASRLALEQEGPAPRLAAGKREPQEVEGRRFSQPALPTPSRGMTAELQQAGLLLVKFEPEMLEPRSHRVPEAPRIGLVLEAGHDVIGETTKITLPVASRRRHCRAHRSKT